MRLPLPKNKLVQFTLVGALLTALIAVGLGAPGLGLTDTEDRTTAGDAADPAGGDAVRAADAPTPNENFTPEVRQRRVGEHEYEEHEEDEDDEYEEYEEYEEDDEYEEYDDEEHEEYEDD